MGSVARKKKVLAIASGGGHWVQLLRLRPAFEGSEVIFATTKESYKGDVGNDRFVSVPDCNRWEKLKLVRCAISVLLTILKEKPNAIVTTGAAPGYFAIRLGKLLGKKTAWIDSIANAEELSLSGQKAGHHADLWITQWKHLAQVDRKGPLFFGNVLGAEPSPAKEPAVNRVVQEHAMGAKTQIGNESGPSFSNHEDPVSGPTSGGVGQRLPSVSRQNSPAVKQASDSKLKVFVTVGTDLPFDRLIRAIDTWAETQTSVEVFAQIGESNLKPKAIAFERFLDPPLFKKQFLEADLIISHAGMGTILSSLQYEKPLLVMPRIASKGEHRNEHQLATAKHLKELKMVNVATCERDLIDQLSDPTGLKTRDPIGPFANRSLTNALTEFIQR